MWSTLSLGRAARVRPRTPRITQVCRWHRRWLSLTSPTTSAVEHVEVQCGSNGSIRIDIHPCEKPRIPDLLILYLPYGRVFGSPSGLQQLPEELRDKTSATVVQINYRSGNQHCHPTPVHDVLFGYDWVVRRLRREQAELSREAQTQLVVVGDYVGGGLAAMLALTECHMEGCRIHAAALHNPILDWTYPETQTQDAVQARKAKRRPKASPDVQMQSPPIDDVMLDLVKARSDIFKNPEEWFDPFASPALFFRTAGVLIPERDTAKPLDDFDELSLLEQKEAINDQLHSEILVHMSDQSEDGTGSSKIKGPRKAARRYPKADSRLVLPKFRITTSPHGLYHDQAADFAQLIRRSLIRDNDWGAEDPEIARMYADYRMRHVDESSHRLAEDIADWLYDLYGAKEHKTST